MKVSPYGLIALVILGICTPTLVLAETENEANEITNDIGSKQTNAEQESGTEHSTSSADSNLILFVTVSAIVGVAGYSAWKVYKIRRRATSKALV